MTTRRWTPLVLLALAAAAACDGSSGPDAEIRQPGELTILRMAADAPPLETYDTTFTAIRGVNSELRIDYEPLPGESSGEEFLRFELDNATLVNDEHGDPIPIGGSIEIRVRIVDPARLEFEFQPAGLRFNAAEPAQLRIRYANADDDFDDDGDVDADDDLAEQRLGLWRQEVPGEPWVKMGSVVLEDLEEVEGEIFGFTRYSIAF
ncbi:MAG TPA: hypothetical protein VFZ11_06450 [Gemmatimonadaceae bacterium]